MNLRPLNDRVIVKRLEAEEKTAGGLFIPDTAKDKPIQGKVLAVGKGKKIKVVLFTREEFEGRPGLGSVYGVVWLYSEGEGSLSYYLAGRVGVADAARVRETAEALVAETQGVAVRYSYLLD